MKLVSLLIEDAAAKSHPSRGAWIEIRNNWIPLRMTLVAPLAGCVD